MEISDFSVYKYKTLLYLKKLQSFLKGLLQFYADSREKSLGSALFSKDSRVTANILFIFWFNAHFPIFPICLRQARCVLINRNSVSAG